MIIDVAKDFSRYPAGRVPEDGDNNGTRFREHILVPALKDAQRNHTTVVVDIDGVRSFGSSFLEEAFAGLIHLGKFNRNDVKKLLEVRCTKPHLFIFRDAITSYINAAKTDEQLLAH